LYQLSAPEIQYIPPTIQPTEPKIEKIITPINKEIVNLENEKKSKQELYGPLIDYLSESTKYSLLGKKEKNYSNSEVQLINSMINTKFNAMNKQFNSEHKDQCLKLLSKIRNEIEGNPKIQNQQQILADIKALTKKINMIRIPR
jgi:acid stress-induced BolA-like protein IbaG/YrbA